MDLNNFVTTYNELLAELKAKYPGVDFTLIKATETHTHWSYKFSRNPVEVIMRDNETGETSLAPRYIPKETF